MATNRQVTQARVRIPILREGRFPGTIWQRRPEGLFSLVAMHVSRFRNCAFAERNRIGGARKKWESQKPRVNLRREIHAAQECLEARVAAQRVKPRAHFQEVR